MVLLCRMTRLHEGPGEKYEGRKSATPIIYQIHNMGCDRADDRCVVLTEAQAFDILLRDCSRARHLMTCMSCESAPLADKFKQQLR